MESLPRSAFGRDLAAVVGEIGERIEQMKATTLAYDRMVTESRRVLEESRELLHRLRDHR